jgi:hypothetical protein
VFVGARDSSSPVLNVVFAGGGATRALHGAAPEEEGDGAAAASFDDEGDARWTAAEELRLSKGDECDAWFSSRRRPFGLVQQRAWRRRWLRTASALGGLSQSGEWERERMGARLGVWKRKKEGLAAGKDVLPVEAGGVGRAPGGGGPDGEKQERRNR